MFVSLCSSLICRHLIHFLIVVVSLYFCCFWVVGEKELRQGELPSIGSFHKQVTSKQKSENQTRSPVWMAGTPELAITYCFPLGWNELTVQPGVSPMQFDMVCGCHRQRFNHCPKAYHITDFLNVYFVSSNVAKLRPTCSRAAVLFLFAVLQWIFRLPSFQSEYLCFLSYFFWLKNLKCCPVLSRSGESHILFLTLRAKHSFTVKCGVNPGMLRDGLYLAYLI